MEPNRPRFRTRAPIGVALVAAASLTAVSAQAASLSAQELPAGVTTELVDQALLQQIDAPPTVGREPRRAWATFALPWVTMALAIIALMVGWTRGDSGPVERVDGEDVGGEGLEAEGVETRRRRRDPASTNSPAKSREALVLPSHVTDVLERVAARRRAEALATQQDAAVPGHRSTGPGDDPADPDSTREGLDFVVPGYDPWKGR